MKNLILFDDENWAGLWPLTLTRPTASLRVGIFKIEEKWSRRLSGKTSYQTQDYLTGKFVKVCEKDNLFINGSCLPDDELSNAVNSLEYGQYLAQGPVTLSARYGSDFLSSNILSQLTKIEYKRPARLIRHPEDLVVLNSSEIQNDFELISRTNGISEAHNQRSINDENVIVGRGSELSNGILNTSKGPIFISSQVKLLENVVIHGPAFIGEKSVVKVGAVIYGGTSIGPGCTIGGEVKNSTFYAYSNKGHYGYIGDSVIGEWCNLGAGTTTSNMKNTYGEIGVFDMNLKTNRKTGLQFCGAFIGDYTRSSINSLLTTGSTIGVNSIVHTGLNNNYVRSFSWDENERFTLEKAISIAKRVHNRRQIPFSEEEAKILHHIYHNFC